MSELTLYHHTLKSPKASTRHWVWLHGWGTHSGIWDRLVPFFLPTDDITLVDLPGMGRSPLRGDAYDLKCLVAQLEQISGQCLQQGQELCVMGWSLGGLIAQAFALQKPELVKQLVVLNGTPRFVAESDWPGMNPKLFDQFKAFLVDDWRGTLIRFLALQCKDSETNRADIAEFKSQVFMHGMPAEEALEQGLALLGHTDLRPLMKNLQIPSHWIFGDKDQVVFADVAKQLVNFSDQLDVCVIPGAAHAPMVSHPRLVHESVKDFLNQLEQRP